MIRSFFEGRITRLNVYRRLTVAGRSHEAGIVANVFTFPVVIMSSMSQRGLFKVAASD